MQEARKPRNLAGTSRVTITHIGIKHLLDPVDHLRDQLALPKLPAGQLADTSFQRQRWIALVGAHSAERHRQRHVTPIQVGDIEHERNPGVFVNEA